MVEFTKTIKDPLGLHARPVALLYDIIAKHRSDVSVSIGDRHTDGRDVMGLMALYGECGEDIVFRVSGVDEASCVTSIRNLSHDRARQRTALCRAFLFRMGNFFEN